MKVKISEPVVVAEGPNWNEVGWGPWQFPSMGICDDGTVVCGVHVGHDDENDYGMERKWFKSRDNGETWEDATPLEAMRGRTKTVGGDRILIPERPPEKALIPATEGVEPAFSLDDYADCYIVDDLKGDLVRKEFPVRRVKKGGDEIIVDTAKIEYWPYASVYCLKNGGGVIPPFLFGKTRTAPDGSIWATHYQWSTDPETGKEMGGHGAYFFRSADEGRTWRLASWLDPTKTPPAGSFLEPDIGWSKSGKAVAMLRSNHIYWATSDDGGYTWNKPERFLPDEDWLDGVMPAICFLNCGAAIVGTGRPHFILKTACDFEKDGWDEGFYDICSESCCYSEIVAISDNEALVTYVDFQHPGEDGINHKTLKVLKVTFTED